MSATSVNSAPTVAPADDTVDPAQQNPEKSLQFWLVFLGTCVALFLSALELTSVGTALPTIVQDLQGNNFIWVGSAYALASTACMPPSGGLSNIFGRQPVMLGSVALFAVGSAICGAAQSMNMLIAGRAVQGAGGGGILTMTEIIVSDLVPLRERGKYQGIIGAVWSIASMLGPPVGGALASEGKWRWLFYMNIPLSGFAFVLVLFFLKMRNPPGHWLEKLRRIDWIGNSIIIASTAAVVLGLTWGGVQFSWSSYKVLVPLIIGGVGMAAFLIYEAFVPSEPTIPLRLMANRTSASGYAGTFLHGMASTMVTYYLPIFLQGSKGDSAVRSGVLLFPTAFPIAPAAIIAGQSVEKTGKYRLQNYLGFALVMIGAGTLSLLDENSNLGKIVGLQIVGAIGLGILYTSLNFPILGPLDVKDNGSALALLAYSRSFGQTFGVTIGVTIIQNGLTKHLPASFLAQFPTGAEISYAIIPIIHTLTEPLKSQVTSAFATSIKNVWYTLVAIAGVGFITCFFAKAYTLHMLTDQDYGFEERQREADAEKRMIDAENAREAEEETKPTEEIKPTENLESARA